MKRAFASFVLGAAVVAGFSAAPRAGEQISLPGVGHIGVFRPGGEVTSVALFLSARGGWGKSESAITGELTSNNTLVLAMETGQLERSLDRGTACAFLAGSLQDIARAAEKQLNLPGFIEPMLVGYGEGGSYAYGAMAEAPDNTFKGGIGLAFDPATVLPRAPCKGVGGLQSEHGTQGYTLGPATQLSAPFTVLQGSDDAVPPDRLQSFFSGLKGARVAAVRGTGRDFTDPPLFKDQLIDQYWQIAGTDSAFRAADTGNSELADLPLTEIRDTQVPEGDSFAIFLSGDGGWADLENGVSGELVRRGIPVVGLSSLKYFREARTPEGVAADLDRVAGHYLSAWHKKDFIIVGYSFGADVAPFAANRLDAGTRLALRSIALIGASHAATFEFHVSDWLTDSGSGTPTRPETDRLSPLPVICIHGQQEDDSLCPDLTAKGAINVQLDGGHHLDGAYSTIAKSIAGFGQG